ncbi:hypothetical protein ES332_A08G090900v1 [Gossypium tomentosum]|uniref:TTF-type domain-containing protein n=1 Tax=Gossypium tomentosum TaxID=34277 RepID=A0A5D2PCC6_GOSTO|nr:hypothetical protein ES332_A08G090900v1 [Gossypium tomentosum]
MRLRVHLLSLKSKTIDSFFKKKSTETTQSPSEAFQIEVPHSSFVPLNSDTRPSKIPRVEDDALDLSNLEREPGLRKKIYEYPVNMRDKIRRAYIKAGPYQPILSEYPASNSKKHPRYFQPSWFKQFSWLEYSPSKDAIFCLPCFLFNSNPTSCFGSTAFTHNGFSNWKKVHDGCNCAFLTHMGKDPTLLHNNAQRAYVDLMNQAQHIEVSLDKQTTQQISANRLRLKTSIDVVRWFSFQGCAFRGHDESSGSKNRGNFLELLSLLASYDEKVEDVLKSAPQNASYTSSTIQKKILQIYANRVRNVIREEIGDRKFRIIVDEVRDESKKEQMAIILRFVDKQGQNVIFNVLLQHSFDIQNIRGQAYDGASNMRGEFNGLQALILNDCRYAYYVHCFAHRLQLALVVAGREVVEVHQFFKDLSDIVNIASASSKRHDELQKAQAAEISRMNQIGTLQRPGETRWSSHLNSVTSLLKMYSATSIILENLKNTASNYSQRGDAHNAYNRLRSFEFIFILHVMKEVLGITDNLCQALQRRSQDILNTISLVLTTKDLIQKLRDDGWNELLKNVISFCETSELDFPNMNAQYIVGRSRNKKEDVTVEHHYRLQELKSRFNKNVVELLTLTTALDLKEFFKLFDIDKICILVNKLYPKDFSQQEKERLPYELKHYELDVCKHPDLRNISTLSELCRSLVESGKSVMYPLVDKLIRLILTLPVSAASSERAFSAMKIVKTRLCSKMEDDFLRSSLVMYIEKEIAEKFDMSEIIDDFSKVKDRRVQFK